MSEPSVDSVVFERPIQWAPIVVNRNGSLFLKLGAGADALHQPRTFYVTISQESLEVMQSNLPRHLLLWRMLLPLCDEAGISAPIDSEKAIACVHMALFGRANEIDDAFRSSVLDASPLIAYGADATAIEAGDIYQGVQSVTEVANPDMLLEYEAMKRYRDKHITLQPIDVALLRYTGQYLYGASLPMRHPESVATPYLPDVLAIINLAEQTAHQFFIHQVEGTSTDIVTLLQQATIREQLQNVLTTVLRAQHPSLADDAVVAVIALITSELRRKKLT